MCAELFQLLIGMLLSVMCKLYAIISLHERFTARLTLVLNVAIASLCLYFGHCKFIVKQSDLHNASSTTQHNSVRSIVLFAPLSRTIEKRMKIED